MEEKQPDIVFANDEEHREYIIAAVKKIIYRYDEDADVILFGSRARGDWHGESDPRRLVVQFRQSLSQRRPHQAGAG